MKNKNEGKSLVVFLIGLVLLVLAALGFVMNIVKLFSSTAIGEVAVRIFGILFPPIGMIAGWF